MNDEHIDNLLSQGLQGSSLDPALHQRFLEQSSLALSRTCQRRCWTRRACYTAVLALVLALGFAGGRIGKQQAPSVIAANTIEVPRDMVVWLEAGHLFTRFKLEQRASFAYERARLLARSVHAEQQVAQSRPSVPLSQNAQKLANLLAQHESLKPRPGSPEKSDVSPLLATIIGERR